MVKNIEESAQSADDELLRQAYTTEIEGMLAALPKIADAARRAAANDESAAEAEEAVAAIAPMITRTAQAAARRTSEADVRTAAQELILANAAILDFDEVDCPHCAGRGQTGLVGDLFDYCGGSCVVTEEKAEGYDPEGLDEVDCPHCAGRGQTGLVGDLCRLCGGSCVVKSSTAHQYARRRPRHP